MYNAVTRLARMFVQQLNDKVGVIEEFSLID